jgi:glucose/arabinose dehydrogenase
MRATHRPSGRPLRALLGALGAVLLVAACTAGGSDTAATTSADADGSTGTPAPQAPATSGDGGATTGSSSPPPASATPAAGPVVLLGGLDVPWSVVVLPDDSALVSVRNTGEVYRVPPPGSGGSASVVGRLPVDRERGEGGLLGLAIASDFTDDPVVYAYYSTDNDNRVAAVPWRAGRLGAPRAVLTGIPRAINHNGGRVAFGPDGYLYVGTGDAGDADLAQNLGSLGGKILRVTRDGDPAPGNPFGASPIWSYGHRNVQGLAWDSRGRLWASEFGANTWDELNLIEAGRNYGWPVVEGRGGDSRYVDPVAQWATSDMSPSGIAVGPDGAVYLAALRGQSVWRVPVDADGNAGTPTRHLEGVYGRVRDVRFVDGRAWILTSNGTDDRLVSLPPSAVGAA